MRPQVVMSPHNAVLCVATPLFKISVSSHSEGLLGHEIILMSPCEKPLAYVIDCEIGAQVFSAEWVEENLIFLGEL